MSVVGDNILNAFHCYEFSNIKVSFHISTYASFDKSRGFAYTILFPSSLDPRCSRGNLMLELLPHAMLVKVFYANLSIFG